MMNERFTTLDQVVRDICEIGGNDLDHKNYGRVLKLCVQTLRSYNLYNSTPYTKTEEIEILPNNTARLPKNALSVLRVGYTDRCGRIHEIFHNKNLSLADKYVNEPCKCFDAVQQIDTIYNEGEPFTETSSYKQVDPQCDNEGKCKSCGGYVPFGYPSYSYGYNGGWYSTAYLYSRELAQGNINIPNAGQVFYEAYAAKPYPAWYGYYNVDLKNGVIRLSKKFNHQLNDKVTVVYSTDMVEVEGAKVVAVEWFDMLLYRCKEMFWSINSVDSQRNRQLYERERTRIVKIYNRQTMEEWRKAIMEVKYSGVKR